MVVRQFDNKRINVAVFGDALAQTCGIVSRYCEGHHVGSVVDGGLRVKSVVCQSGNSGMVAEKIKLVIHNVEQNSIIGFARSYLKGKNTIFLVFNPAIRSSFNTIARYKDTLISQYANVDFCLVSHNVENVDPSELAVTTVEAQALAKQFGGIPFFSVSAKYGINIDELFIAMAAKSYQRLEQAVSDQKQMSSESKSVAKHSYLPSFFSKVGSVARSNNVKSADRIISLALQRLLQPITEQEQKEMVAHLRAECRGTQDKVRRFFPRTSRTGLDWELLLLERNFKNNPCGAAAAFIQSTPNRNPDTRGWKMICALIGDANITSGCNKNTVKIAINGLLSTLDQMAEGNIVSRLAALGAVGTMQYDVLDNTNDVDVDVDVDVGDTADISPAPARDSFLHPGDGYFEMHDMSSPSAGSVPSHGPGGR